MKKLVQYIITAFLVVMTLGGFMISFPTGIVMLLATLLACPFTRNLGISFIKNKFSNRIPIDRIKGWMYGLAITILFFVGVLISPASNNSNDNLSAESEIAEKTETLLVENSVENEYTIASISEDTNENDTIIEQTETIEDVQIADTTESIVETTEEIVEEASKAEVIVENADSSEILQVEESVNVLEESAPSNVTQIASTEAVAFDNNIVVASEIIIEEQESIVDGTIVGNGAYAVNDKNGKIHSVGNCPATGNGKNAMDSPVYFDTYEEAEVYSIKIAPNEKKRKCGNCW